MPPAPDAPRRAAVLGSPIRHSLSPVLHRAAYAALGLAGWTYEAVELTEPGLPDLVRGLDASWAGLSLTMPLKLAALEVADSVSPLAAATAAANTLVPGPDGWRAENTDVTGIVGALRDAGFGAGPGLADMSRAGAAPSDAGAGPGAPGAGPGAAGAERDASPRAVVLGAGGTARAALAALRELGATDPLVLVRDESRAGELRDAAARLETKPEVRGLLTGSDEDTATAARLLAEADVVISTLPAGAADALAGARWNPATVVLDVVYAPWPTTLAAGAALVGCRIASGLDMLLHQAVAQVALMTGRPGPLEAMRTALDEAVRAR